jgi:hypothetical protein
MMDISSVLFVSIDHDVLEEQLFLLNLISYIFFISKQIYTEQ